MNNIETLKADISAAEAIVAKAQPLADKLAEMQAAAARIAEASRTLDALRSRLAQAEQADQYRAAAVASYSLESILPAAGYSANAAARHVVTTSRNVHGLYGPEPLTERSVLDKLSPELLAVVVANEDSIPAYIRALDADPEQALRKHAQHASRGYVAS